MDLSERFRDVLSSIEFQLARSLPFFTAGKECIFFYKIKEINITEYQVSEIRYIVIRDLADNKIEVRNAMDVIPLELLNRVTDAVNQYTMSVEEELELEDDYLELYEDILKDGTHNEEKSQKLYNLFLRLTEKTALKDVYLYLDKKFSDSHRKVDQLNVMFETEQ